MKATITKYKGKPILSIPTGNAYHFSFGKSKAKLILDYLDDIYEFAGIDKPNNGNGHRVVRRPKAIHPDGCWYCTDGHKQTAHAFEGHTYNTCNGCGASIIPILPRPSLKGARGRNYKLAMEVAALLPKTDMSNTKRLIK